MCYNYKWSSLDQFTLCQCLLNRGRYFILYLYSMNNLQVFINRRLHRASTFLHDLRPAERFLAFFVF